MIPTTKLSNGVKMPLLGLGTWKMANDEDCVRAVQAALAAGYRLIDTASMYGNEEAVGRAIRESDIPREEIFLTTKLWPTDFFHPQEAFDASLMRLGLDYVDLYLVHWPIPMMPKGVWTAMEAIYKSGKAKAIGVSNYGVGEFKSLFDKRYGLGNLTRSHANANVAPMVNQIQLNPFHYHPEILRFCEENDIVVEAYSPLTRGAHLADAQVAEIADAHGKTPAQILLRWCIEHGVVAIPKTQNEARMRENADIFGFSLTKEEMDTLNALR